MLKLRWWRRWPRDVLEKLTEENWLLAKCLGQVFQRTKSTWGLSWSQGKPKTIYLSHQTLLVTSLSTFSTIGPRVRPSTFNVSTWHLTVKTVVKVQIFSSRVCTCFTCFLRDVFCNHIIFPLKTSSQGVWKKSISVDLCIELCSNVQMQCRKKSGVKPILNAFFPRADWADEAVTNAEILRLIYQGRFLHCNVTLSALGLATGKTTVMHLVPRENLPEPNSQGMNLVEAFHFLLTSHSIFRWRK